MTREYADAEFVQNNIGALPIVDVRPASKFAEGHIPSAINVPFNEGKVATVGSNGPDEDPQLAAWFAKQFDKAGIGKDTKAIISCQTGRHATMAYNMLAGLGYKGLLVYRGSWQDWSSDPQRPIEK